MQRRRSKQTVPFEDRLTEEGPASTRTGTDGASRPRARAIAAEGAAN
jgi:hypothetical protein